VVIDDDVSNTGVTEEQVNGSRAVTGVQGCITVRMPITPRTRAFYHRERRLTRDDLCLDQCKRIEQRQASREGRGPSLQVEGAECPVKPIDIDL